ncbi:hypothetical protein NUW58_g7425 [Xylaria curta]|uniref:Uncharacterized protein n=1 Tax=Xylaria curta TaxID=42375 RepID=A0ACC1NHZ6_9PEZI|nr:hypothetical protein NUW58_g7425 [Xylaria curta]
MGAPYYGAYAATALMANAASLTALDDGNSNYAAGTRSSQSFELRGLAGNSLRAKRLVGDSAAARVDQGGKVTFGGQTFTDGDCKVSGSETFETLTVSGGQTAVSLRASEALLVYLK